MSKRSEQKGARKVHCCSDKMQSTTKDERRKEFQATADLLFFLTSARMSVLAMRFLPTLGQNLNRSSNVICENPNGHCVTATTVVTLTVQSFRIYVNRTQCDWDWALCSLHVAPSHSGSLCVPMSSAWHVFPHWTNNAGSHSKIRKLAQRLYTLACWIASQISAKASLFHGQTLPSSTTGTQR